MYQTTSSAFLSWNWEDNLSKVGKRMDAQRDRGSDMEGECCPEWVKKWWQLWITTTAQTQKQRGRAGSQKWQSLSLPHPCPRHEETTRRESLDRKCWRCNVSASWIRKCTRTCGIAMWCEARFWDVLCSKCFCRWLKNDDDGNWGKQTLPPVFLWRHSGDEHLRICVISAPRMMALEPTHLPTCSRWFKTDRCR